MFKKILLLVILAMSVVGCELISPSYWDRVNQRNREEILSSFLRYFLGNGQNDVFFSKGNAQENDLYQQGTLGGILPEGEKFYHHVWALQ